MKGGILAGKGVPMGGRRRRSRSMGGGSLYGFASGPYDPAIANGGQLADGTVRVPPPEPEQVILPQGSEARDDPLVFSEGQAGGRRSRKASRKAPRKSGKSSGKRSPWLEHVMSVKAANPTFSLGDAMKAAKKTYKK